MYIMYIIYYPLHNAVLIQIQSNLILHFCMMLAFVNINLHSFLSINDKGEHVFFLGILLLQVCLRFKLSFFKDLKK